MVVLLRKSMGRKKSRTKDEFDLFIRAVKEFYKKHKRDFPWRLSPTPYRVFVSEMMLQQTQAERVVPYFNAFMDTFSTIESLAHAPLRDVLGLWQGLGYNRRARFLKECAQVVCTQYEGVFPTTLGDLMELPGIGPYTAGAIRVFALNTPEVFIETNIRTVYIHHFFQNKKHVRDSDLLPIIKATLDTRNPRAWYSALMDYGSYLKKIHPNPSRRSAHHVSQMPFKGSRREVRGRVLRCITEHKQVLLSQVRSCGNEKYTAQEVLADLVSEGMVQKKGKYYIV